MHMRVLLFLGCFLWFPCIVFSRAAYAWGRWRSALNATLSIAPEESPLWGVSAIHRTKSILLTPFAWLSNYRLPKPYCALRSQHLLSEMHSLSIIPELYSGTFPQKSTFLKIPFSFTFPIPLRLKTKEEPKMNQGTPKELPTTKKCFLLRF